MTALVGKSEAVKAFTEILSGLYEKDYGDFMRKVVVYIERLRVEVGESKEASKIIAQMRHYLVFAPDFDIENTRLKLLRDANEIRRATS